MKNENMLLLDKMITAKSKELGFTFMKPEHTGSVVSMLRDDWHLFMEIQSPIVPALSLQMSIDAEDDAVRMLLFPSPPIIGSGNALAFIQLSNLANRDLYMGDALGRFWVDVDHCDFAYELILKENLLHTAEIENQLFDVPYRHFRDLHIPLVMLRQDIWQADTAISYLTELREKGYVDNSSYGLW